MKRLLLYLVVIVPIALTSCTTTMQTISTSNYLGEIDKINSNLFSMGYKLSGKTHDEKNEVYVSSISYSTDYGYGSAMDNDYYWYDTYRFIDDKNNTASYQVKYKCRRDDRDGIYVSNVSITRCDCSDTQDYSRICGAYGITNALNYIENDQVSTFDDDAANYLLGYAIGLGLGFIICIPLLSY
ncbi:MAG: hypothetical protein IJ620_02695 [Bacteroidales bacterium]|nr:hypothetical protein [Bacteroidales bacterium]